MDAFLRGGDAPPEYIEYYLCSQVYHCTPVELDSVPLSRILTVLKIIEREKMNNGG